MEKLLKKAIIGYKLNHPGDDLEKKLAQIILNELDSTLNKIKNNNDIISYLFEDNYFKNFLIKEHITITPEKCLEIIYNDYLSKLDEIDKFMFSGNYAIFVNDNRINIIGSDWLFHADDFSHINIEENLPKNVEDLKIIIYPVYMPGSYKIDDINVDVDQTGNIKVHKNNVFYGQAEKKVTSVKTNNYRELMHDIPIILIDLLKTKDITMYNKLNIKQTEKILEELIKKYIKNIDVTEVLKESGLKITKNAYEILSNGNGIKLLDSFNASLLSGKIELSTDRGYESKPEMPQQDAVLSIVKNENCFLNMVVDGAGGSEKGEEASKLLIEEIKDWFEILPDEILNDIDLLIKLLKYKISQIDSLINQKYHGSYTTMVLSITVNDKTVIANIGDSAAYTYDKETDDLVLLTTLDSDSKGLDYEEARYNPWNNTITAAIGAGYNDELHINIIDNIGQKIILSSDGITDLVSEETFKSYFKENIPTSTMIEDALSKKYTDWLVKTEDNISVIVINLPNYSKNKVLTK